MLYPIFEHLNDFLLFRTKYIIELQVVFLKSVQEGWISFPQSFVFVIHENDAPKVVMNKAFWIQ